MPPRSSIREQLKRWQSENDLKQLPKFEEAYDEISSVNVSNDMIRLSSQDDFRARRSSDDGETSMPMGAGNVDEQDEAVRRQFLRRGDLVEISADQSDRDGQLAIFVQEFDRQSQYYTMRGKWIHRTLPVDQYSVRSFVESSMVEEILPYMPDHEVTEEELDQAHSFELDVPREVGAKLVERMVTFWRDSEAAYRQHASALDNAHPLLAHSNDLRFGHIQRIARRLVGKVSDSDSENGKIPESTLYAVHKALNRSGFAFSFDKRSHGSTGIFQIRPRQQVEMVEKVRGWLRAYQEDMTRKASHGQGIDWQPDARNVQTFVEKAKQLISRSRRTREATQSGNVGPSSVRFPIESDSIRTRVDKSIQFTETDQAIIRFMEAWSVSRLFLRHTGLSALGPVVLRATGEYESHKLQMSTGFMFLQEIGVLLPYENRVKYDEHLLLPTSQHSPVLERLQSKTEQEDYGMADSMQGLRTRWTDAVFCIDSSSAVEIDDGISVERIPQSSDELWIHVHVANPTAFFNRDNLLAKISGHMTETVYMPERNYLMLPRKFSVGKFSLQNDRAAITFSARLNRTGEILERKITPSILRRVIRLTPHDCRNALGIRDLSKGETSITVGGKVPTLYKASPVHLDSGQIQDLRLLIDLTQARRKLREEAGALSFGVGEPEIKVYNRPGSEGLGHSPPYRHVARFVDGDPVIQMRTNPYRLTTTLSAGNPISALVEESMLLACEVSASWCKDRGIPVVYRGIGRSSESADPQAYYDTTLRPLMDSGIPVPLHLSYKYLRLHGQVVFNSQSLSHRTLGLPHFTRVTSPLRRYGDMIAHWQIEAVLREEARTGRSLAGAPIKTSPHSPSYLPFSRADIDLIIQRLQPRERLIRGAKVSAQSFWYSLLLWRAWKYGEAELPKTFEVLVYRSAGGGFKLCSVLVKEWGAFAYMVPSGTEDEGLAEGAREGDSWEAQLLEVDVYERRVFLQPIKLLDRSNEG
ncbi:RNB-domain-containing protein [Viridothelium virens]|uniref:RNB-domain-containing protein n=1 Tax=Viridothelium virens TaxID=1048519 RepID=A0A6A6GX32_VIRVR|nr:RNB-domain-containing protein [Viridothelium virens]